MSQVRLYIKLSSDLHFRHYSNLSLTFQTSFLNTSPGSTSYHSSSASASARPSSSRGQERQLQTTMKKNMENELRNAMFYVDLTAKGGILYANPRIVDAVIDELIGTTFPVLTSGGTLSATSPRFPANGCFKEEESYEPLTHLLNKIVDTANPRISISSQRASLSPFWGWNERYIRQS